ncbi:Integrase core domain protein [Marinomonas gallaica]|uniref:Integrase core domain protein n=1 Tax=Marinomonas gallaica TaxID=1806667 RepID=A0A1C3JTH9_9GAMM|nr:Integrase core domain protein [Marinomonas gallaica]SBT22753.1 Integrase core domain protein [Marinomonas gallaica]
MCKETSTKVVSSISIYDITADDTVLGKQGTGAIVSLVERKSKMYLIRKVPKKSAEDVCRAIGAVLWRYRRHVHTITADNGTEFCAHESIARSSKPMKRLRRCKGR